MFSKKTEKIINDENRINVIVDIYSLLSPIFYENPEKLTLCERNIVYIHELTEEVYYGGFVQYFMSDSANYVEETINALRIIGSKVYLDFLEAAINKFPDGIVPKDKEKRKNIIIKLGEKLWYELDGVEEEINKLLIVYIKNNINEFR